MLRDLCPYKVGLQGLGWLGVGLEHTLGGNPLHSRKEITRNFESKNGRC